VSIKTLTRKQITEDLQISTETLRRWERDGVCPQPIWLSPGCVRFLESDIEEWFERERFAANNRSSTDD